MSDKVKNWEDLANQSQEEAETEQTAEPTPAADSTPDAATSAPADVAALQEALRQAQQKADENLDKAMRAMSELENGKRRAQRDVEHAHKFGLEKFIKEIIQVVDSLEHAKTACESSEDSVAAISEGVLLTHKLLIDTLAKFSVTMIDPVGETFDPNCHEAMSMQPAEGVAANTITAVIQKGFRLHDRVIRPARVIVAK